MKNLKRIILMVLAFVIAGRSANCQFREKLERRSAQIRQNIEESDKQRSDSSSNLSKFSRTARLMFNRVAPKFMQLNINPEVVQQYDQDDIRLRNSTQLSIRSRRNILQSSREYSELCELTQEDSDKVISIISFIHEYQDCFSACFIDFIDDYFNTHFDTHNLVVLVDKNKIKRYFTKVISFSDLRKIYHDSILSNIKFIRDIFEEVIFDINFEYSPELNMQIPLSVLLMFDIFEGPFDLCIKNNSYTFFTDEELSEDIKFLFERMSMEGLVDFDLLDACEYLQINFDFILYCFITDMIYKELDLTEAFLLFAEQNIKNMNLEFTEIFIRSVKHNAEENKATEIFNCCLRILNPEYCDAIISRLSHINEINIVLDSLYITEKQLCFIITRLEQLINLMRLDISGNQLTVLPDSISGLFRLHSLDISNNQLEEFNAKIRNLTNLRHFYIDGNQLEELSVKIENYTNLYGLYISDNRLTELPESLLQLTHLNILDIRNTSIEGFNNHYEGFLVVQDFMNSYFNR